MLRRVLGLMLLFVLLFPPIGAAAGFLIVREALAQTQVVLDERVDRIQVELREIETTVEEARAELASLVTPIQSAVNSIGTLLASVGNLNIGQISIPGLVLPDFVLDLGPIGRFTIVIPNIPAVTLTIPGLSSLRGLVEGTLSDLEDLASGISTVLRLRLIPTQISQAAAEVRALVNDLTGAWSAQSGPAQLLALACGVWLVLLYVVALGMGLRTAWRMLTGRP